MELPTVSVIVPVHNAERIVGECIESILDLNYPKEKTEVIVVDNNSTDSTKEVIQKYPVRYLFESRKGQFYARNLAVKNAKGEILAFTDGDCEVDKNWLKNLMRNFTDDKIAGVGGKVVAYNPQTVVEKYSAKYVLIQEWNVKEKYPYIVTANAAYRRKIIEELGYFDGAQYSGGDVDMGWRVTKAGYKLIYEPDAVVLHKHRTSLYELYRQFYRYGRWYVRYFKKHRDMLGKNHTIDWGIYKVMFKALFLRLPWRILNAPFHKGDKALYVGIPICQFVQWFAYKLGRIRGSIERRIICL
ncbi:MAG: glycosyltransferase [Candidatus Altiarchaeota archaeon]|nr:glycosyltransferase [Candidatus Altiarchaeota archaeon]